MKFKKFIKNDLGNFEVRKMPDARELDDIRLRGNDFAESFDEKILTDAPVRLYHQ